MSDIALACENLGYNRDGHTYFDKVSFELRMGEGGLLLSELNRNARALLLVCATLQQPSDGQMTCLGTPVQKMDDSDLLNLRRRIALVHRDTRLISNMTILENITLGSIYHNNVSRKEAEAEVFALLERFGLYDHRDQRPAELSFEKQRLAVYARELSKQPGLFLMEAPSSDLGQRAFGIMMGELRLLADREQCAFLISALGPEEGPKWVEWVLLLAHEGNQLIKATEFDADRHRELHAAMNDTVPHGFRTDS